MKKVIVIGAGPAGMFAAIAAAKNGHSVMLLEKNEKTGKKLFITGKGRCNITNAGDLDTLFANVTTNRKFLYSAFYAYDNVRVIDFFHTHGLKTKTERGNRVFPVSDHSSDVIAVLNQALKQAGVKVRLQTEVSGLWTEENVIRGVFLKNGEKVEGDAVILAAGGFSYQSTGSTGDGYLFAEACGHKIVPVEPSLVPCVAEESYVREMQGLSLKNVRVIIRKDKKILFDEFGEMLFTHFGVSGPVILSASSHMQNPEKHKYKLFIDLKPALDFDTLDKRVQRDFLENHNRDYINSLSKLLPNKLIPIIVSLSKIPPSLKVNQITKEQRTALVHLIKNFEVDIVRFRPIDEAIITSGGVSVKEINPKTMQSKLVDNLYFAGEVIDVDAYTGGFNLQIAFSTGYLCGKNM